MAQQNKQTFLVEFQQTEVDDTCGMKRWMTGIEGGSGLQAKTSILPEMLAAEVHSDLQCIAQMTDISPTAIKEVIDDIISGLNYEDLKDTVKMELLYRRLGWLAAFAIYIEPEIRMDYEPIVVDSEIVLDREPLWVIAHPDRVLRHKKTKELQVREYIPMPPGLTNQKWLHSWHFNMRMHVTLAAVMEDLKLGMDFGIVMGMSEGYISTLDGRLAHPYTWGYRNKKTNQWSNVFKSDKDGWELAPVWEFPGGIVGWVKMCGEGIARNQFPLSPPIILNKGMLDNWVERKLHREREIKTVSDIATTNLHLRGIHFERRTAQCRPITGEPCSFLTACWNVKTAANPLKSGGYVANRTFQLTECNNHDMMES